MNFTTRTVFAGLILASSTASWATGDVITTQVNLFTNAEADESGRSPAQRTNTRNVPGYWTDMGNQYNWNYGESVAQQDGSFVNQSFVNNAIYRGELYARAEVDTNFLTSGSFLARSRYEVQFTLDSDYFYSLVGFAQAFSNGDYPRSARTTVSLTNLDTNWTIEVANVVSSVQNFNASGILSMGNYRLFSDSFAWVNPGINGDSNALARASYTLALNEIPAPSGVMAMLILGGMIGGPRRSRR